VSKYGLETTTLTDRVLIAWGWLGELWNVLCWGFPLEVKCLGPMLDIKYHEWPS